MGVPADLWPGAEYTYPECTTACVTALSIFKKKHPDYRRDEIERVSNAAIAYVHRVQRVDGSWYGSWGIVSGAPGGVSWVALAERLTVVQLVRPLPLRSASPTPLVCFIGIPIHT